MIATMEDCKRSRLDCWQCSAGVPPAGISGGASVLASRFHFSPSPPTELGDLSRLGNGERNSAKPKAREGRVSGQRASHWVGVRWHVPFKSPQSCLSVSRLASTLAPPMLHCC